MLLKKMLEIDRYANENWTMTTEARRWLKLLEAVSTVDHSWAEEIGDYDEGQQRFKVEDEVFVRHYPADTRVRILREREWYRNLRAAQPRVSEKYYHLGDKHQLLLKKIVLGQMFGLSITEIQTQFELGESYHSHGRGLTEAKEEIEEQQQKLVKKWKTDNSN